MARLQFTHLRVGGGHALVGGDRHQPLGGRVGHGRTVRELLGQHHGGGVEVLVGHHPVDHVPAFHGGGVVAAAQERHLFGPGRSGSLGEPLHRAHERVQAHRHLYRAQLGRLRGDHQVGGQGQLEPAADAHTVHRGHDGGRVFVERA
jgi:hypothetical protein